MSLVAFLRNQMQLCAKHTIEKQVALAAGVCVGISARAQNQVGLEANPPRRRRRRATVVALQPSDSDDAIAALGKCLCDEEFELAHLVSTELAAGVVIALDPQLGSTARIAKPPSMDARR